MKHTPQLSRPPALRVSPKLSAPRALLAAMLVASSTSVFAANITLSKAFLDSVNGFVNFAKPTLGSGSLAITNNLQPGDTVFLEAQTRPLITLVNLNQGTAANPIIVTNLNGQFVIDYPDPAPTNVGVRIWGAQHVHFKGTPGAGYAYGIKINKAGLKVEDNNYQQGQVGGTFENTIDLEISSIEVANSGFAGIMAKYEKSNTSIPAGYTALLDGLRIHDCYIHHTDGEGMYLGQTLEGRPDVANVKVYDNLLEETGWDGIQLNRSRGTNEIYNNRIIGYGVKSNTFSNPANYFWQGSAFSVNRLENFKLHNNYVQATGMYSAGALSMSFSNTTEIYNNVFVLGSHGAPAPQPGFYISQWTQTLPAGTTLTIANNTFVEPENNGIQFNTNDNLDNTTGAPKDEGGITVPVKIINNIIAHPLAGTYVVNPALSTPTQTTNLFVSSLAAAGFVGATDFHLAPGSAAIDAGTAVSFVTYDYDYNARPFGAKTDIGAYEFYGEGVITPVATGTATGSSYCPADGAFNEQPTWSASTGTPVGLSASPHVGTGTAYANRFWYADLGPNWAKIRITQMWTRYRPSSAGSYAGFLTMWWDNDYDTTNDGITATGMNFATAQNLPYSGTQLWVRDRDFSSAPVVPQGRYLVVATRSTVTDRPNEFAFIGYLVP